MLEWLHTSDETFFKPFAEIARRITAAATLLRDGLAEPARLAAAAREIATLEHEADRLVHEVTLRLDRTMFAPMDLEDVPLLLGRLDAVMDLIDEAARWGVNVRIPDSRVADARAPAVRLGEVLLRAAESIEAAAATPRERPLVLARCEDVRRLESIGDAVYSEAVTALFAGHPDPVDALRWKQLYDELEDALDACKAAASVVERIVLAAA
jgi:uncharacterized protein Yka (UPF0111/DUF47 family)